MEDVHHGSLPSPVQLGSSSLTDGVPSHTDRRFYTLRSNEVRLRFSALGTILERAFICLLSRREETSGMSVSALLFKPECHHKMHRLAGWRRGVMLDARFSPLCIKLNTRTYSDATKGRGAIRALLYTVDRQDLFGESFSRLGSLERYGSDAN
jgi:hypothetical protein